MYLSPPRPFMLVGVPKYRLNDAFDEILITSPFARLHFQSMGTEMDMVTLGDLDFLLTLKTEHDVFMPFYDRFIDAAMRARAENGYRKWCGISVFEVDMSEEAVDFRGWLPEGGKLLKILEE